MTPPEWGHVIPRSASSSWVKVSARPVEQEYVRANGSRVPVLLATAVRRVRDRFRARSVRAKAVRGPGPSGAEDGGRRVSGGGVAHDFNILVHQFELLEMIAGDLSPRTLCAPTLSRSARRRARDGSHQAAPLHQPPAGDRAEGAEPQRK